MEYRKLGSTGLDVGVVGLGTEYLNGTPRKTVVSVVQSAIARGVNYVDLVFNFPEYLDNLGAALDGYRERVILAAHVGPAETNGHYRLTRDVRECQELFHGLLRRLRTDHVDVLFIQMVNSEEGYDEVMRPAGVMELVRRLQDQGKARFVGMSGHTPPAILKAVQGELVDVLMLPINLAWDFVPGRKEVFQVCASHGVGLVAMKPFAGGRLFQQKKPTPITPVQCIHYVLSQPGLCTVVPGVKNTSELTALLHYVNAKDDDRDFGALIADFQQEIKGNCVYCNHCLPCPVGIDIGRTIRLVDVALLRLSDGKKGDKDLRSSVGFDYASRVHSTQVDFRSAKASACVDCGVCMERCPFDVDVVAKMKQAVELFEEGD